MVKEKDIITWDTRRGGLIATRDLRIGNIVLQSKPLPSPDEKHLTTAISEAIKQEGEHLLSFDDEKVIQWQNRVMSLKKWNPEESLPDVSTHTLLVTNEEWLSPYLNKVKKPEDLKKLDLHAILSGILSWEKQQALEKSAPTSIKVPSGSSIKIKYQGSGEAPILAVRLQEVFGLDETPKVNKGKVNLILHLLSPGYKPVQITSDLKSFWSDAYFEVRKDLKKRYPKHSWPDDPWTAEAVRGVKKRHG